MRHVLARLLYRFADYIDPAPTDYWRSPKVTPQLVLDGRQIEAVLKASRKRRGQ